MYSVESESEFNEYSFITSTLEFGYEFVLKKVKWPRSQIGSRHQCRIIQITNETWGILIVTSIMRLVWRNVIILTYMHSDKVNVTSWNLKYQQPSPVLNKNIHKHDRFFFYRQKLLIIVHLILFKQNMQSTWFSTVNFLWINRFPARAYSRIVTWWQIVARRSFTFNALQFLEEKQILFYCPVTKSGNIIK